VTALTRAGYAVRATGSAAEAVTMVDPGDPIDVLVTDVVLTELSGPRVADEVASCHPDVAVLFMSGYPDGLLGDRDLDHGRRTFIGKPFTVDRLLREVATLCALPPR
jgi:two-component system, cell cycle sensor histidine kinase and response regulator CckA